MKNANSEIFRRFAAEWRGARVAVKKLYSYIDPVLVRDCSVLCMCLVVFAMMHFVACTSIFSD
jgi:hypothetical protein